MNEKDDRVKLDLDPEEALRALLKVDPDAHPPEEDDPPKGGSPSDDAGS